MDLTSLSIHSTHSDCELVLNHCRDEQLRVNLKGAGISASAHVSIFTDAGGLNRYFQELGKLERPWPGERSWASIEEDFVLSVTCTSLGIVAFRVELRGAQGAPEGWWVKAGILLELGQLPQIARKSNAFFSAAPP